MIVKMVISLGFAENLSFKFIDLFHDGIVDFAADFGADFEGFAVSDSFVVDIRVKTVVFEYGALRISVIKFIDLHLNFRFEILLLLILFGLIFYIDSFGSFMKLFTLLWLS